MIRQYVPLFILTLISVTACTQFSKHPIPPAINVEELAAIHTLNEPRQHLVRTSLALKQKHPSLRYLFGGDSPEDGGLDCSGSVAMILRAAGYDPPRTSADQFLWLQKANLITKVPKITTSLDDVIFDRLRPGDLLFWSGTYKPKDGRKIDITHVQIYLGQLRKDGRHVMIGASDGHYFAGTARNGFGAFDFRLPSAQSKSKFVGFGPPPLPPQ